MKIAIGRLGHIGDIIACEPVSRYLRHKHPEAHLTWVVEGAYRELIDTNPHIDETVAVECTTDWIKLTKHGAFDEIVDLHPNYRACHHCRVPLIKRHGNPFVNIYEYHDYGTLLEAFSVGAGLPRLSAEARVYLQPQHAAAVDALALPPEYCVIHRQSTNLEKDWPVEGWRAAVAWIRRELGMPVVEIGVTRPRAPSPLGDLVIDLVNRTTILETAEVIRRARFFVGVDSAPAHLANAVRTPGIVLLGRLGVFPRYMPFNGFFAADGPEVEMVRNLTGPVRAIPVADVTAAIRRVASAAAGRKEVAAAGPAARPVAERDRRTVGASGLFDASWYAAHHPEAAADPLDHFLAVGGALGYAPGPDFDLPWYVAQHDDVRGSGINPLLHFLERGRAEGRPPRPEGGRASPRRDLRDIANPAASGEGMPRVFTFAPPHGPSSVEALRVRVRQATEHGVTGLVFRCGNVEERTPLGDPVAAYARSDLEAPFLLQWAPGGAGGGSKDGLMRAILPLFADARYAKVDGKPLLLLHETVQLADTRRTVEIWRDEVARHGFPGLYLVTPDGWSAELLHPRFLGFDAAYETASDLERVAGGEADYRTLARLHIGRPSPAHRRFRTVTFPPSEGDADREAYRLWLTQALLDTSRRYAPEERLVFLQPHGGPPDGGLGDVLLEETRVAVSDAREAMAIDPAALVRRIERERQEGLHRVVEATERSLHVARAQLAQERRERARLEASTSWRATAPLRATTGWLRAAFRRLKGQRAALP